MIFPGLTEGLKDWHILDEAGTDKQEITGVEKTGENRPNKDYRQLENRQKKVDFMAKP